MYHIEIYDTIFQSNESLRFKILKARLLQSMTHTQKLDYVTSIYVTKLKFMFLPSMSVTSRILLISTNIIKRAATLLQTRLNLLDPFLCCGCIGGTKIIRPSICTKL